MDSTSYQADSKTQNHSHASNPNSNPSSRTTNSSSIKYAEKNYTEADYHDVDSEEADIVDIDEDASCLNRRSNTVNSDLNLNSSSISYSTPHPNSLNPDFNSHSNSHANPHSKSHSNSHPYQNTSEMNSKSSQEVDSGTLKHIEDIDKPREKLLSRGAKALELEELIAVIIGRGSVGNDALKIGKLISKALLTYTYEITIRDLLYIPGIGEAKACQILAALELARRFPPPNQRKAKVMHPSDVLPFVTQYRYDTQENFIVISLTGAHEVINVRHITKGILDHCQIHPREVFAGAIEDRAASIVLVHNHPSGSLEPSKQDLLLTESMKRCGELLGVHVLDHIIIGPIDDYYCV